MKCRTIKCENDKTPRTPYCANCNAGMANWSKRRPGEVLERRRRLSMYGDRVDRVIDKRGIRE